MQLDNLISRSMFNYIYVIALFYFLIKIYNVVIIAGIPLFTTLNSFPPIPFPPLLSSYSSFFPSSQAMGKNPQVKIKEK